MHELSVGSGRLSGESAVPHYNVWEGCRRPRKAARTAQPQETEHGRQRPPWGLSRGPSVFGTTPDSFHFVVLPSKQHCRMPGLHSSLLKVRQCLGLWLGRGQPRQFAIREACSGQQV